MAEIVAELSAEDEALAIALAAGVSVSDAAGKTGISSRTIYRRKSDDAFAYRVRELRASFFDACAGQLASALTEAAAKLRDLMKSSNDVVALQAAKSVITIYAESYLEPEMERRLASVERKQGKEPHFLDSSPSHPGPPPASAVTEQEPPTREPFKWK